MTDWEESYWWDELPPKKRDDSIKFEVCCVTYGQGDCGFSLFSEEDLRKAWAQLHPEESQELDEKTLWFYADPMPITDVIPTERQVYFTDVKDMLEFVKQFDITLKYSLHGHVY
jgi:hypothetical protein